MSEFKEKVDHPPTDAKESDRGVEYEEVVVQQQALKRQLKNRHIAMISIGPFC